MSSESQSIKAKIWKVVSHFDFQSNFDLDFMDEFRTRVFPIFDNLRQIMNEITLDSGSSSSRDLTKNKIAILNRKYYAILSYE